MSLVPYRTYDPFDDFRREIQTLMPVAFSRALKQDTTRPEATNWHPAVDVKEEPSRYLVSADIPGVEPKDIEVTFDNGVLTIRGHRQSEKQEDKEGYHRIEREYGSFARQFNLPDGVDAESITAKGKDGVLLVEIPKREKDQPKKIAVS